MNKINTDELVNINRELLNRTNDYINNIIMSISDNFKGVRIDDNKISNLIKVYYFDGITTALKKEIRKVNESLEIPMQEFGTDEKNSTIDMDNFKSSASKLINVESWLNKYNDMAIPELVKLVNRQFEETRYMYGNQYDYIMHNVKNDIKREVNIFTNSYSEQMRNSIETEIKKLDINKELDILDIKPFQTILELSNIECHIVDNKIILNDNVEAKIVDNRLVTKDDRIECILGNNRSMCINHEQNTKIIQNASGVSFIKNGKSIDLFEGFAGLEIWVDGKIINDSDIQEKILYSLRSEARGLYNLLKTDHNFSNRIKLIEEKEALLKQQEELIKQKSVASMEEDNIAFKPFG